MLKSFRSSDKKGTEGIEFGDEWYKRLMEKLVTASDVVCLLTERSLGRPWILYEAGVAKGKLNTPVHGLALGVPLASANSGPFYQFQNSDDSEDSLKKLVGQLCRRIPGMEPDTAVIAAQVTAFRSKIAEHLKATKLDATPKEEVTATASAKVLEEMKNVVRDLSVRMEHNLALGNSRKRPIRHISLSALMTTAEKSTLRRRDPVGLLVLIGPVREDLPWIYELGLELYKAIRAGRDTQARKSKQSLFDLIRVSIGQPYFDDLINAKDLNVLVGELPAMIDYYLDRLSQNSSEFEEAIDADTAPNDF
jgi:hypothetical protein